MTLAESRDAILDLRAGENVYNIDSPATAFSVVRADEDAAVCLLQEKDGSRGWQHLSSLRVHESFLGEAQCGPAPEQLAQALGATGPRPPALRCATDSGRALSAGR